MTDPVEVARIIAAATIAADRIAVKLAQLDARIEQQRADNQSGVMSRSAWDALSAAARSDFLTSGGKLRDD